MSKEFEGGGMRVIEPGGMGTPAFYKYDKKSRYFDLDMEYDLDYHPPFSGTLNSSASFAVYSYAFRKNFIIVTAYENRIRSNDVSQVSGSHTLVSINKDSDGSLMKQSS